MDRPYWFVWRTGIQQPIVCQLANDVYEEDDNGFVACEYPVFILEQGVEKTKGGHAKFNFAAGPLSALVDISRVLLRCSGYAICHNHDVIEVWEKIRADVQPGRSPALRSAPRAPHGD